MNALTRPRIRIVMTGMTLVTLLSLTALGFDIRNRDVESRIPGARIPGWQMSLMNQAARAKWPRFLSSAFSSHRHFDGPFWTPSKDILADAALALRAFLESQVHPFDSDILQEAIADADCLGAMHTWQDRQPPLSYLQRGTPINKEWVRTWKACEAAVVLSELDSYRAQYLGVGIDGRPVVYVNAYCDAQLGRFAQRLALYDVLDGGLCYFQAYYDPEAHTIEQFVVNGTS